MAERFLAVVTLVKKLDGEPVDPGYGIPAPPDVIWGGAPPTVTHPIAPGGSGNRPALPIYNPGSPEHPIVLPPDPPVEVWPPVGPLPEPGHPMVPAADHIFVVGYAPGYGAVWVKVAPQPVPAGNPLPKR